MQQYIFAEPNGSTGLDFYDKTTRPTQTDVENVIKDALAFNGRSATFTSMSTETYKISFTDNGTVVDYYVSLKPVTPGGRSAGVQDEHRILQLPVFLNDIDGHRQLGDNTAFLGVYIRGGEELICAWQVSGSNADPKSRISKQIKVDTLADAFNYGFAQQKRSNEYCCAFRKEFLYYFLKNSDWLCGTPTTAGIAASVPTKSTLTFDTGYVAPTERNKIVFGAPGTGKSFKLEEDIASILTLGGKYERVTFHPEYSYAHFIGTYKPIMDGKDITYSFVPGPFLRVWIDAVKNGKTGTPKPHILLIEEINRARVAAVFGDVFQLLDRDEKGVSKYGITISEDIKRYLAQTDVLGGDPDDYCEMRIPDNMLIWATMNSADQGVFPMDTAFKRRWNFEYLGIDANEAKITSTVDLVDGNTRTNVSWNKLRKAINKKLSRECKVNEDKLIGPFFLSEKVIETVAGGTDMKNPVAFRDAFKSKVIMYLYEDAAKQYRDKLFGGCDSTKYSSVCNAFDKVGMDIFGDTFKEKYYD